MKMQPMSMKIIKKHQKKIEMVMDDMQVIKSVFQLIKYNCKFIILNM